jgi:tripartite-type tricarboxylate transporter receptor subunit TctC
MTPNLRVRPKHGQTGLTRRSFGLLAAAPLLANVTAARADTWPSRPIRIEVPFAAGVSPDVVSRMLAEPLGKALGQPVVVDNRAGAAGIIGAEVAARSAPDGYTLFMAVNSIVGINPHVYSKLPYDTFRDFVPVTQVVRVPYVLVTGPNGFADMRDVIARAKARPGSVDYASLGVGSGPHVVMEMFSNMAGIRMTHVPQRASALPEVMAGHVPLLFDPVTTALPLVRGGKLRALAVTSARRLAALPEVPAVAEVLPGYEGDGWQGFYMPAGTPAAVVQRMNRELVTLLARPDIRSRLGELGLEPVGNSIDEFTRITRADFDKWGRIARANGIRTEG